jgi:hypothetical protein
VRFLAVVLLFPCAALAQPYPPRYIDRPLVLPGGVVEAGLLGNLTNLSDGSNGGAGAADVEIGFGQAQLGLVLALPVAPGFGFGSLGASGALAIGRQSALRLDFLYDHATFDAGNPIIGGGSADLISIGLGVPFRIPLDRSISLVSGKVGAMHFAHFINLGNNGATVYLGGMGLPLDVSDLFVFSTALDSGDKQLVFNLPLGLMIQPVEIFSVTLRAGFETIMVPDPSLRAVFFVPLGADAVLSVSQTVDVGLTFSIDGLVGTTAAATTDYAGFRMASLWVKGRF